MEKTTLLWGTANPEGVDSSDGIFLSKSDIKDMIAQIEAKQRRGERIPVHVEHAGVSIGHVVSAWEHAEKMEIVLALNENVLEGSLGSEFVRTGMCKDLSLGYEVAIENSIRGVKAKRKDLKEVSIVKRGARRACRIKGVSGK